MIGNRKPRTENRELFSLKPVIEDWKKGKR